MSITFEVTVNGPQIGRALANDPEEFWYALAEIVEDDHIDRIATEIADHANFASEGVVAFLRDLADKIEKA